MKKVCICAMLTLVMLACKNNNPNEKTFIDLGLTSGTLWCNQNESNLLDKYGFYDFDAAVSAFSRQLPSKQKWQELIDECEWTWTGEGSKVIGPNGNSIFLPAQGYRDCNGHLDLESGGLYWTSTVYGSEYANALEFTASMQFIYHNERCNGYLIRLIK